MTETQEQPKSRNSFLDASADLAGEYARNANLAWDESPYKWLISLPSAAKGSAAEKLVSNWARREGLTVKKSTSSDADRIINGHRIEIKMSTLWTNGSLKFQQIRDQQYDHCLCLAILPQEVYGWLIPKDVIRRHATPQHTGATGTETLWLPFLATDVPSWMHEYGGSLDRVIDRFEQLGFGSH